MTTKQILSEQIQRLYARFLDKDNPSDVIDIREIKLLVNQSINKVLKLQVAESFKAGMIDVPKCNLMQYSNAAVVQDSANSRAYVTLPAIPLTLPMDMGIWSVTPNSGAMTPYIPIPAQDMLVFQGTNLGYLEGKVGYYVQGKRIYFTKDITLVANGSVSGVTVNLLVSDFSQLTDNEMLPISPEVESTIIDDVLQTISNGRVSQAEIASQQQQQQ
jgi:hypothetical protein